MTEPLYADPRLYDLAVASDVSDEVHLLRHMFERFGAGAVHRILEPACGTGRLALGLAMAGEKVIGYDREPAMVDDATERARQLGLSDRARFEVGDMAEHIVDPPCDAAFNALNGLGHLRTDDAITAHVRCMAASLRPGAVYALQLTLRYDPIDLPLSATWHAARGDVRVDSTWTITREDHRHATRELRYHLLIDDHGRTSVIEGTTLMRSWTAPDVRRLLRGDGLFDHLAVIDPEGNRWHEPDSPTGTDGPMWFILRRTDRG